MSAIFGILRFDGNEVAIAKLARLPTALKHRAPCATGATAISRVARWPDDHNSGWGIARSTTVRSAAAHLRIVLIDALADEPARKRPQNRPNAARMSAVYNIS